MKTEKFKSLVKRAFAFSYMFVLTGMTVQAQFSLNGMGNATAIALRDPARQASTEVDAALYNPAGTAFLQDGFHVSLNGLFAYQPLSSFVYKNEMKVDLHDESIINIMPSVQLAWKKGRFSVSASLADEGSMGKWVCPSGSIPYTTYLQGLSHAHGLDGVITELNGEWLMVNTLLAVAGYGDALDVSLEDQYRLGTSNFVHTMHNFATRLGAAYAINDDFSVYVGVKLNYFTRNTSVLPQLQMYRASTSQSWEASEYFSSKAELLEQGTADIKANPELAETFRDIANSISEVQIDAITTNHSAMGIAPVLGVDYRLGNVNLGAKYEFQTAIKAEDWADFKLASNLSLGVDWTILDNLSMALGGTAYFRTNDNYGLRGDIKPNALNGHASFSISYSPLKRLLLSAGQTYESYSGYWFFSNPEDVEFPNRHRWTTSLGCAYDITERLQFNVGGSIGYKPITVHANTEFNFSERGSTTSANCPVSNYTNMKYNVAVGVNYRF